MQKITADLSQLHSPFSDGTPAQRVESGALQIGDDWPGVFLRGDHALYYAMMLSRVLDQSNPPEQITDIIAINSLKSLVDTLRSCAIITADDEGAQMDLDLTNTKEVN